MGSGASSLSNNADSWALAKAKGNLASQGNALLSALLEGAAAGLPAQPLFKQALAHKGVAWQIDTWASKFTLAVDYHQVVYLSVRFAKIRVYERHMEHLETPKCGHLTSFDVAWIN